MILTIFACEFKCLHTYETFDQIISKILTLHPSQISFFRNGVTVSSEQIDMIFKKITCEVPTYNIDTRETKVFDQAVSYGVHIVLENSKNTTAEKMKKSLQYISKLGSSPRVKCLIILVGNSSSLDIHFKQLFIDAWALKFLDLSIFIENDMVILNYNPFFNSINRSIAPSEKIFPNKLINMNSHKIRLLLYSKPPHIEFSKNSEFPSVNGMNYGFLKLTSTALNFAIDFVEIYNDTIIDGYVFDKIERGEVDMSTTCHGLGAQLEYHYRRGLQVGRVVRKADMHLVSPIHYARPKDRLKIVHHLVYSSFTALIILVILSMKKLWSLSSALWTPFYVFSLLFGMIVVKRPAKRLDRIIYIILAVFSMKYSSFIFAVFTNDDVIKNEEVNYDAMKEIMHPSLTLYIDKTQIESKLDDEVIRNLKKNSKLLEKSEDCFKKMAAQKNCFCFHSAIYSRYMIQKYSGPHKPPVMKLSYPILLGDFFVYIYGRASPYIGQFDRKFQQILESGIQDSINNGKKYLESSYELKDLHLKFEPVSYVGNQLIILMSGIFCGTLVFIYEFISRYKEIKQV